MTFRSQRMWRHRDQTHSGYGPAYAPTTGYPTFTLIAALGLALLGAALIAPFIAVALGAAGFRFPFPRIFDRTLMVTVFAALLIPARRLKILALLRQGFRDPASGIWPALSGLVVAGAVIAVLFALAGVAGADIHGFMIARSVLRYFPAALLIAVLEEAFFRAFLLAGIERQFGALGALLASSALYATVHVMRSPAHFYLTDFEPWAGVKTLAADADRVIHPNVGPPLLGLFLLGLVLGEAFLLTRRAYASLGLHAGFVLGAKTWRTAASGAIPQWIAGPGSVPLVAAPATWILSMITLTVLYLWSRRSELSSCSAVPSRPSSAYRRSSDTVSDSSTGNEAETGRSSHS